MRIGEQVSKALRHLGVQFEEEQPACKAVYTIDIVVRLNTDDDDDDDDNEDEVMRAEQGASAPKRLAIECDGPTHFVGKEGREPDQRTLRKRELLQRDGWEVLSVPYWEWPRGVQAQRSYMRRHLEAAGVSVPQP
eukprot:809866-Rhodomonas_salina.1